MATVDTTATTDNPTVTATETTTTVKDVSASTMNNGCDIDKKEEEPLTTPVPTISQKKDNENENTNSKSDDKAQEELLKAGTKLLIEEKYSEACDILSSAMQVIQEKDIANTIESVKYYMAYGEALLRLVQSSNDLFAAPVRESQQQHLAEMEEEDDDVDLAEPQLVTDATEKSEESKESENGATTTETKPENSGNSKEEQDEDDDVDLTQSQTISTNSKEEAEDEPAAAAAPAPQAQEQGDVDTSDDREYAWESFEYARGIIEEYLNKEENKNKDNDEYLAILASAHAFLGELLIEDERNDDALTEFNKAIELQNKCKPRIIKCRSKASNHFMACLAAQFADKDDEAVNHCDAALKGLSERISGLLTQFECTESTEMKENDYQQVIKVAEDFMGDNEKFHDEKKNSEDGKELKDLVGIMGDLCAKLEEVKEIIQLKKDGKYGNDTKQGDAAAPSGFDAQLMMDPLQALISGLTSKFGIDEEQLAAMAGEEEGDDENKNTSNKNIPQSQPNGVTTIGFGNVASINDDEEVNDLDLCVKRKNVNNNNDTKEEKKPTPKVSGKKRKMEDADIDDGMDEVNGAAKKMKLNSGDAAPTVTTAAVVANNEDGK
mmetsp:Transcript_12602/g.11219  ORF Transcript_12602/g.11219 Transcript_12602/m.11219 type:complete len:608 (+) Transcript_12602:56-1879(+)